jgi:hypothetical protein
MTHELICTWLELSPGSWPPDHYTLLALAPGENDYKRIEQQVHERMERVRRYQLTHPEATTEAMNRLAQALVCLTDPAAKKAYDAAVFPAVAAVPEPATVPAVPVPAGTGLSFVFGAWQPSPPPPSEEASTQLDWQTAPPPTRVSSAVDTDPGTPALAKTVPPPAPPLTLPETVDPLVAAARSPEARRGLGTKRAFYFRVARTRQLLHAWERAGKYLADPTWSLSRPAEATELMYQMQSIRELLRYFPPLLGEIGQAGHYVVALARQQAIVPALQMYSLSQRELLARDWKHGQSLLLAHRNYLRESLQVLRRQSHFRRQVRAVRDFFWDHTGSLLLLLAGLTLLVCAVRIRVAQIGVSSDSQHAWEWLAPLLIALGVIGLGVGGFLWHSMEPRVLRRPVAPVRPLQRSRPRPRIQKQPN